MSSTTMKLRIFALLNTWFSFSVPTELEVPFLLPVPRMTQVDCGNGDSRTSNALDHLLGSSCHQTHQRGLDLLHHFFTSSDNRRYFCIQIICNMSGIPICYCTTFFCAFWKKQNTDERCPFCAYCFISYVNKQHALTPAFLDGNNHDHSCFITCDNGYSPRNVVICPPGRRRDYCMLSERTQHSTKLILLLQKEL